MLSLVYCGKYAQNPSYHKYIKQFLSQYSMLTFIISQQYSKVLEETLSPTIIFTDVSIFQHKAKNSSHGLLGCDAK